MGKSRLVSELKEYLASCIQYPASSILEGRCVSIGESMGYWAFIDMLRGYLDFAEDDTPDTLREKIANSMKALFPQRWEEIVPYIANLLSVRGGEWDDRIRNLPPEQIKQQTFFVLRDVFFTLAQQKPLLLIFEDLHWADSLSLDMVNLLMDALSLAPIMLLCVYRPYKEHRSWHISAQASAKCLDRYREITLRPLSTQESKRLVSALLDIENLPESVRESILTKAEGNPFFVEEVIRSLIESGFVYQDGDRWMAKTGIEEITVPDTIQNVIMSRIDRLEDEARYMLQSASVIGRLFRHKLLQYTTHQERDLDRYLWQLEEKDMVYEERVIPELEYSFRHALTQETAYNTILSRRRREFHLRIAQGYETLYSSRLEEYYQDLAYHYSHSDDKEKALEYLVKAGDKSRQSFANDAAIEYYRQALALTDEGDACVAPTAGHIYQSLGEIYFPLTKYEEALESCHKALEYVKDKRRRAKIYGMIGFIHEEKYRQLDTALEYLNAGIAELGDDTECPEMAWLSIPLFWVAVFQGDKEKAIENALRGLKIVENTEHYFETAELCRCLAFIYAYGRTNLNKGYEYAQRSLEAARKSGNLNLVGRATSRLGEVHMQRGENDAAAEFFKKGIEITRKTGDNLTLGYGYWFLSGISQRKGDWDSAIECAEHGLEIPGHPARMWHLQRLANAYFQKGDAEKAIEYSKEALESAEALNSRDFSRNLGLMEKSFELAEKREEFISYCIKLREKKAEALRDMKLNQWYLEPLEVSELFTQTTFVDEFDGPELRSEWEWVNPRGDSSYSFSSKNGWLEVRASAGSNLMGTSISDAPRLLHEISGNFAVEVKIKAVSDNLPSVGGLLVWNDEENFIRFERGMHLENEISFSANIQGKLDRFGRGRLPSDVLHLRLERIGDRFSAYCSDDGESWLTCGYMDFPADDPIKVGICALGFSWLPGGDMDTATQFGSFRVLRRTS